MLTDNTSNSITVSIVSHGQSKHVCSLLKQLASFQDPVIKHVIVTSNAPCLDDWQFIKTLVLVWPFELTMLNNSSPLGFGSNHNQAFKHCLSECFCVLNPDISLFENPFAALKNSLSCSLSGCSYPVQINMEGELLDYARVLPTPLQIAKRHLPSLITRRFFIEAHKSQVHWVNGACLLFKTATYQQLKGFDERYFMYCEDVDICLRIQLAGLRLVQAEATVVHQTQRRTLRSFRHLTWHFRSLIRLWLSEPYRLYSACLT